MIKKIRNPARKRSRLKVTALVDRLLERKMRDHTKLRPFDLADEVVVVIYRITRKFPREGSL